MTTREDRADGSAWKVWALLAGRSKMDRSLATYLDGMGQELVIPHTMFVVRGPSIVLVDTSFESADVVRDGYPQEISRTDAEEPLALLATIGVRPEDVDAIVCTHLHYDHCGSNRLFPQARVWVQRRELEYAQRPTAVIMEREFFAPSGGFRPPYDIAQFEVIDGDREIGAGLRLVALPGHTPGLQGVIVRTASGRLGILGDHVMLRENWDDEVPVGLHTDLDAWYRSTRKAKALVDAVAPSHDLRLFPAGELIAEVA